MAKINYSDHASVLASMVDGNEYSNTKIKSSITTLRDAGVKFDVRVHATAVALLDRILHHRDSSLVPALIEAMPKSARRKDLIAWFHLRSNCVIRVEKTGKVTAGVRKVDDKLYREGLTVLAGEAAPFWIKPEAENDDSKVTFGNDTLMKRLERLLKDIEGADEVVLTTENATLLQAIKVRVNVASQKLAA